ncbi:glycosyltransferase family 92 protein [Methanocorpusculum sp.]|nr:glycosyltransferase family 92 protein [Methanocorpusculum sp.]
MVEWIEFHKLVGVDRFYIYDAATDNTRKLLKPYIESGEVVYFEALEKGCQNQCYNHFLSHYRNKSRWVAIIDADEFIVPVGKYNTIPELLHEFEEYPAIGANWIRYDSNNHVTKPEGLVIENYTQVHADFCSVNLIIKSIVNPRKTICSLSPHECLFFPLSSKRYAVTENFEKIPGGGRSPSVSTEKIRINHYYSKSLEEYKLKISRGMADSMQYRPIRMEDVCFENPMQDDSALRFVEMVRKSLKLFESYSD